MYSCLSRGLRTKGRLCPGYASSQSPPWNVDPCTPSTHRRPERCLHSRISAGNLWQSLAHLLSGRAKQQPVAACLMSTSVRRRRLPSAFPVLDEALQPIHNDVFEANLRNSQACQQRYIEYMEKVKKGGGENAVKRHTQRNKKMLVTDRLRMLFDDGYYFELSPFAGMGLPYGDIPSAGCLTGIGKINGLWCVFIANDATVSGGTAYPITVKKQLRAQDVAIQNRLPCVYLVDSGGAFLPLQSEIFPDKNQGGRTFYNEAIMSAMKIPQTVMVHRIGTIFLGGPPLVKAATGEEVSPENLGGATLHAEVSGCVDHFASVEKEAYETTRNMISTLNFELPEEDGEGVEEPRHSVEELMGLAPQDYDHSLDVKLILSRLTDGSKFQEFKARYGTTLVTGFARISGHQVGIVASNGALTHNASLKGSHFVQLCDQRDIPLIFLQNTVPMPELTLSQTQAETNTNRLKAQGSMMSAVACASVPKITIVIGGCHGAESYAMVLGDCLKIIKQQEYQLSKEKLRTPLLRM
ncbi:unnamed protein product [Coregonus sp. 'balchen']|nr:unnamed protein product [Coregonus sp. 'balchen']